MHQRGMTWFTMCAIILWAGGAAADPVYEYAFDAANYLVAPGGPVDIDVYLKEIVGSGNSVLDANGAGMFGAGVVLNFDGPSPTRARVLATSDITPNSAFNDTASGRQSVTATSATLSEVTDMMVFVHADDPTPGLEEYLMTIGTFRFTAGLVPGEVTTIYTSGNPLGDVVITGNGESLDGVIGQSSFTITTIPEPSALVLSGFAVLTLLMFRCWARRSDGRS